MRRAALALALALVACAGPPPPPPLEEKLPLAGAHIFVRRPFRAIPEPDRFIVGAVAALKEELVRSGYDVLGESFDPEDDEAILQALLDLNRLRPGTAGILVVFVEAPTLIGFGTAYTSIDCTVRDPKGRILLETDLELPEQRPIRDLLLPRAQPEVDGRYWAKRVWRQQVAHLFPPRGPS